jgi:hypothetical protein
MHDGVSAGEALLQYRLFRRVPDVRAVPPDGTVGGRVLPGLPPGDANKLQV